MKTRYGCPQSCGICWGQMYSRQHFSGPASPGVGVGGELSAAVIVGGCLELPVAQPCLPHLRLHVAPVLAVWLLFLEAVVLGPLLRCRWPGPVGTLQLHILGAHRSVAVLLAPPSTAGGCAGCPCWPRQARTILLVLLVPPSPSQSWLCCARAAAHWLHL